MRIGHLVPYIAKRYTNPRTRARALFLAGKSGIGKSDAVRQACDLLGEHIDDWQGMIDLRLSQMEPVDLRGVPVPDMDTKRTVQFPPDMLPHSGAGILFLDEFTSAPPSIQAAAYQITLTPWDYGIPREWMIIAAGNLQTDRGVTFQMAGPLINRFNMMEVSTTLDDFLAHAITKDVRPEVLSFLKDRADMLHKFDGKGVIEQFPSPRSWFAVSDSMELDLHPSDRIESFTGDVGKEAALAFETHLRVWESMPSLDDVLAGKDVPVPSEINVRYCVAMGIAARVDEKNFDGAWNFLQKLPGDIQTMCIKLAYKRCKSLVQSPAFAKWAAKNQAAFKRA